MLVDVGVVVPESSAPDVALLDIAGLAQLAERAGLDGVWAEVTVLIVVSGGGCGFAATGAGSARMMLRRWLAGSTRRVAVASVGIVAVIAATRCGIAGHPRVERRLCHRGGALHARAAGRRGLPPRTAVR